MIFEETFNKHEYEGMVAVSGNDINSSMVKECFKLDEQFFQDEYTVGVNDVVAKWVEIEKRLCFVVIDLVHQKLAGYTYLFPISTELKNKYLRGEISFKDMKENDVIKMEDGSAYHIFYFSQAFYPGYGIDELHKVINEMMLKAIASLAKNNRIAIKSILFDSVCKYEEDLVKSFSLEKVGKTQYGTDIYYSEFDPMKMFKNTYAAEKVKYIYDLDHIKQALKNVK